MYEHTLPSIQTHTCTSANTQLLAHTQAHTLTHTNIHKSHMQVVTCVLSIYFAIAARLDCTFVRLSQAGRGQSITGNSHVPKRNQNPVKMQTNIFGLIIIIIIIIIVDIYIYIYIYIYIPSVFPLQRVYQCKHDKGTRY